MAKKYTVAAVPGGFAVASLSGLGFLVAHSEYAHRDSAEREAAKLNREWESLRRLEIAQATARRQDRRGRRLVRYFENEPEFGL